MNAILGRDAVANDIAAILRRFDEPDHLQEKKGIYVYGSPGCGKTEFVVNVLKDRGYDVIKYDAGDVRNKSLIETITSNNVSNRNVLDMMRGKVKKIAFVMDEIDGMNNGDKGGINSLIKLIRQKKTKRQKLEQFTMNPIICIGNYYVDKKIKELMKVCHTFELKPPTLPQMRQLLEQYAPILPVKLQSRILEYMQGDLRKLTFIRNLAQQKPHLLTETTLNNIFQIKAFSEDSKKITERLLNEPATIQQHNVIMNDNERTIVALLWHENVADVLSPAIPAAKRLPFYVHALDNMCVADYMDRVTFQNQIWLFNEMSSLIKTFHNTALLHRTFPELTGKFKGAARFTKVLTKYSTEYNNSLFLYNLGQELNLDKKDVVAFFQELRLMYGEEAETGSDDILVLFENTSVTKLDMKRMYRFLDKSAKKEITVVLSDDDDEDDVAV
jgi:DNA polymerase III delta prime subunit